MNVWKPSFRFCVASWFPEMLNENVGFSSCRLLGGISSGAGIPEKHLVLLPPVLSHTHRSHLLLLFMKIISMAIATYTTFSN